MRSPWLLNRTTKKTTFMKFVPEFDSSPKAHIRNGCINLHLEQNQEILSRHIASCLPCRREFWMFKCLYASSRFPLVFPSTQVEYNLRLPNLHHFLQHPEKMYSTTNLGQPTL
ncbi:hypothetical protein NC651_010590 [Populus alba x Populus x berolinensis]|nr:hypothetical protein NC651_010590 [Populus alba x Populus x berolinensis]